MKLRFKSAVIPLKQTHFSNRHLTTFFFFLSSSVMNNVKVSKVTLVSDERVPSLFHFSFLFLFLSSLLFSSSLHDLFMTTRCWHLEDYAMFYSAGVIIIFFSLYEVDNEKNDTIVNTKLSLSELQASSN